MKKKEIRSFLDAVKTIKMTLIEDKVLRNKLINIHIKFLSEQKKYIQDFENAKIAFLASWEDEENEVQKLQARLQRESDRSTRSQIAAEIESHSEYMEAVREFKKMAEAMGNEEVEVERIDPKKFVEEYQKQDYNGNVIEALYPIFDE
jgi:hypothetical protein